MRLLKYLLLVMCLLIIFAGCGEKKYTLVDKSKDIENFICLEALEEFYKDDNYVYSYPCIMSEYVVVRYEDGTEITVKDALAKGKINISDLDKYNIQYYKYQ